MLEDLRFLVSHGEDLVVQPSAPSNSQLLLPTLVHNNIQNLHLDGEILSVLDQCSIPNLKEILILNEQGNRLVEPEVESIDLGVTHLLRFVERSECNVESFIYLKPMVLSKFKG